MSILQRAFGFIPTKHVRVDDGSFIPAVDLSLFQPDATTTVLAVTAASARTALPAGTAVRLSNAGDSAISVRFGDGTVTAATSAMDILPGSAEVFRVPVGATHLAAIVASGTATLKITAGSGA